MRILRITMFILGFGALMPALLPTSKAEAATVTKGAVSSNHGGSRGAAPGGTVSKGAVSPNKGAVSPNPGGGTGSGSGRRVVPYNGNHGGYGHGGYGRGYYGGYYGYRGYYPYYGYSPYYWGLGWGWGWALIHPTIMLRPITVTVAMVTVVRWLWLRIRRSSYRGEAAAIRGFCGRGICRPE